MFFIYTSYYQHACPNSIPDNKLHDWNELALCGVDTSRPTPCNSEPRCVSITWAAGCAWCKGSGTRRIREEPQYLRRLTG